VHSLISAGALTRGSAPAEVNRMKIFFKYQLKLIAKILAGIFFFAILMLMMTATASATYSVEEDFGSAPPPLDTLLSRYNGTCGNDFWSNSNYVCDAAGHASDHTFDMTGMRLYDLRCDIADEATIEIRVQIVDNSTGDIIMTSYPVLVDCMTDPDIASLTYEATDFELPAATEVANGITYAYTIISTSGVNTDLVYYSGSSGGVFGLSLLSGDPPPQIATTISWNNPTQGATLPGYPTHYNFDIHTDTAFCGYLTGYASSTQYGSAQGGTEGSCFPIGTTTYNYYTPGTAATGTIYARLKLEGGAPLSTLTDSSISFSVQTTQSYTTGGGIGPTFPTPSSSLISIDCSVFDFWDSIDVFGAGTIPWPNVADWFPGTACYAKSAATDVLTWAFSVRPETTARFQALSVSDRAPFAYFYDIEDLFATSTATSTNAFPVLVVHMPNFATASSTGISFTAFSSSTITTYVRSENITLFRNLMTLVLWLLFLGNVYFVARTSFNKQHTG